MNFSGLMERLYEEIQKTDSFDQLSKRRANILFLSLGYKDKRAVVFSANKKDFREAWDSLYQQAVHYFAIDPAPVEYLKIDWVDRQSTLSIPRFLKLVSVTKRNHFRFGISLDRQFKLAFLEQEVNANNFIQFHEKTGRAYLNPRNIKHYVAECRPGISALNFNDVQSVTIFTTQSVFLEAEHIYFLKNGRLDNGRRNIALTRGELEKMIAGAMNYMAKACQKDGKLTYGYDPCSDKEITGYDMRRHAHALAAMAEAYDIFPDEHAAGAIKRGLDYLVREGIFTDEKEGFAYVVERAGSDQPEVSPGGAAAAIRAIVTYTQVFKDDSYLPAAKKLAGGIVKWQQSEGNFAQVLRIPALDANRPHRTGTYDAEAALALLRLYQIDTDETWLEAAEKALDYFIKKNDWNKPDIWLGACVNEMAKIRPEAEYFKLGLDLLVQTLEYVKRQEMTDPVHLQALNEGCQLLWHPEIAAAGGEYSAESLAALERKAEETLRKNAEQLRNGFFYPELAIYYKNPRRITGSFFNRTESFRVGIGDIAAHLSAYCQYYKLVHAGEEPGATAPEISEAAGETGAPGVTPAVLTGDAGLGDLEVSGEKEEQIHGLKDSESAQDGGTETETGETAPPPPSGKEKEKDAAGATAGEEETAEMPPAYGEEEQKRGRRKSKDLTAVASLGAASAKFAAGSQAAAFGNIIEQQILQKAANELLEAVKQFREKEAEKTSQWSAEWKKQNETLLETLHQSEESVLNLTGQLNVLAERVSGLTDEITALRERMEDTETKLAAVEDAMKLVPSGEELLKLLSEQVSGMTGEIAALREDAEAKFAAMENAVKLVPSREELLEALTKQAAGMAGKIAVLHEKAEAKFAAMENAVKLVPSREELLQVLKEQATGMTGEIGAFREDAEAKFAALENVLKLVPSREELLQAFSEQMTGMTGEITALRQETAAKLAALENTVKLVPSREEFVKALSEQVSELNREIAALREEADAKLAAAENVVKLVPSGLALIKELSKQVSDLTGAMALLRRDTEKRLEAVEEALNQAPTLQEEWPAKPADMRPEGLAVESLLESGELKELLKEVVKQLLEEGLISLPPETAVSPEEKREEEEPPEEPPEEETAEEPPRELPPDAAEAEEEAVVEAEAEEPPAPAEQESCEPAEVAISGAAVPMEKEEPQQAALTAAAEPEAVPAAEAPPLAPEDEKQRRKKIIRRIGNLLVVIGLAVIAYFAYDVLSMKFGEQQALKEAESKVKLEEKQYEDIKNVDVKDPDVPEQLVEKKKEAVEKFEPKHGEAFAILEIPKLNKSLPILEGTDPDVLDKGVGHLKQSVFPGQGEQIVISGHRDTVFRNFDKLKKGDLFIVHMPYGTYTYKFRDYEIVDKDDTTVVRKMGEEVLVVTTCYPFRYIGNAPKRFVIYAYPVEDR